MQITAFGTTIGIDERYVEESTDEIRRQVGEYERGERRAFDLTVAFPDDLTGRVMRAMAGIPCGETRTYGALAADLDTSPIAVGQACGRNPVPIVIPCHRVVGSDDSLRGYSAADGVTTKRRLLDHEARVAGAESVQSRLPTGD
ncbi:methylated-DNA--[protein]-cysteine S-methyltransferase [Natronorarus salvus]|uniref:methylated-DNA--[protein]-cysteine S-methyltransferase n=1 Tax=Natronorarus salvus TaxID=3117733 RepID=UPI002F2646BF